MGRIPFNKEAKSAIYADFMRGLSVIGLARKYAGTSKEIEDIIREFGDRPIESSSQGRCE